MMNNKLILALSVLFSLPAIGYSQTVSWATPPVYESLEEYTGDLYKIREHGKVGLADISGKILVSADYDSITPFNEFLALALEYAGGKYAVKGIINQHNYSIIQIPETNILSFLKVSLLSTMPIINMVIYRLMALYSSLANILKLILSIQDLLVFIKKRMRSPIYKVQVMNLRLN